MAVLVALVVAGAFAVAAANGDDEPPAPCACQPPDISDVDGVKEPGSASR
ncbi:hypothetical protein [Phytoactinopolyspora limicola]|nr:hypothetical protein [Phytoactinopolyspora limicola]